MCFFLFLFFFSGSLVEEGPVQDLMISAQLTLTQKVHACFLIGVLQLYISHAPNVLDSESIVNLSTKGRRNGMIRKRMRLAIWLLNDGVSPVKINEAKRAKVVKCSESMWKLTYYATVQTCVLMIIYHEPWFRDTKEYFRGWPNQELKFPLKLLYMCQCGFYLYSIAALLTWETRRKDFSIMMSHHIITVILIGYSYLTRFFRIGSIILALHDASDVFLEAAKVFKYSEKELAASLCFGFFAISWLILRLIFFPFWVIRTSSYDVREFLDLSEGYQKSLYYVFNTMLLVLFIFHIYWWILICSMILRQLKNRGKVGEDIRSDSEDEK